MKKLSTKSVYKGWASRMERHAGVYLKAAPNNFPFRNQDIENERMKRLLHFVVEKIFPQLDGVMEKLLLDITWRSFRKDFTYESELAFRMELGQRFSYIYCSHQYMLQSRNFHSLHSLISEVVSMLFHFPEAHDGGKDPNLNEFRGYKLAKVMEISADLLEIPVRKLASKKDFNQIVNHMRW